MHLTSSRLLGCSNELAWASERTWWPGMPVAEVEFGFEAYKTGQGERSATSVRARESAESETVVGVHAMVGRRQTKVRCKEQRAIASAAPNIALKSASLTSNPPFDPGSSFGSLVVAG